MAETVESSLIVPLARPVKARPRTGMTGAPQPITLHDPVEKPKTPASAAASPPWRLVPAGQPARPIRSRTSTQSAR